LTSALQSEGKERIRKKSRGNFFPRTAKGKGGGKERRRGGRRGGKKRVSLLRGEFLANGIIFPGGRGEQLTYGGRMH